ncbi:MAG: hypothetical protein Q8N09_07215 [Thermodesulfovibrionia bacterium]|nr:hypothetical protein [Thermodesulfovibrionia bacterium]
MRILRHIAGLTQLTIKQISFTSLDDSDIFFKRTHNYAKTKCHRGFRPDKKIRRAQNLPSLIDSVKEAGGIVSSVSIHQQSLEDVFIHYTGKSIREEEAKKVSFFVGAGVPQKLGR